MSYWTHINASFSIEKYFVSDEISEEKIKKNLLQGSEENLNYKITNTKNRQYIQFFGNLRDTENLTEDKILEYFDNLLIYKTIESGTLIIKTNEEEKVFLIETWSDGSFFWFKQLPIDITKIKI